MLHEAELANVSVHDGLLGKETSGQRHAVDDFFVTGRHAMGRRLGLAAWDVEGDEIEVLKGAVRTLERDAPVLVLELHVHERKGFAAALLRMLHGYSVFVVQEVCGNRYDCRNLLALPRSRRGSFAGSSTVGGRSVGGPILFKKRS